MCYLRGIFGASSGAKWCGRITLQRYKKKSEYANYSVFYQVAYTTFHSKTSNLRHKTPSVPKIFAALL